MQHQLLLQNWIDLSKEVRLPGSSLRKLQEAHGRYLSAAVTSCFIDSTVDYRWRLGKVKPFRNNP